MWLSPPSTISHAYLTVYDLSERASERLRFERLYAAVRCSNLPAATALPTHLVQHRLIMQHTRIQRRKMNRTNIPVIRQPIASVRNLDYVYAATPSQSISRITPSRQVAGRRWCLQGDHGRRRCAQASLFRR
jgi:hypothetical protein